MPNGLDWQYQVRLVKVLPPSFREQANKIHYIMVIKSITSIKASHWQPARLISRGEGKGEGSADPWADVRCLKVKKKGEKEKGRNPSILGEFISISGKCNLIVKQLKKKLEELVNA